MGTSKKVQSLYDLYLKIKVPTAPRKKKEGRKEVREEMTDRKGGMQSDNRVERERRAAPSDPDS